jgi:hypothetical protein
MKDEGAEIENCESSDLSKVVCVFRECGIKLRMVWGLKTKDIPN